MAKKKSHDIRATGADNLFARAERLGDRRPIAPDEFERSLDEIIGASCEELERAQQNVV